MAPRCATVQLRTLGAQDEDAAPPPLETASHASRLRQQQACHKDKLDDKTLALASSLARGDEDAWDTLQDRLRCELAGLSEQVAEALGKAVDRACGEVLRAATSGPLRPAVEDAGLGARLRGLESEMALFTLWRLPAEALKVGFGASSTAAGSASTSATAGEHGGLRTPSEGPQEDVGPLSLLAGVAGSSLQPPLWLEEEGLAAEDEAVSGLREELRALAARLREMVSCGEEAADELEDTRDCLHTLRESMQDLRERQMTVEASAAAWPSAAKSLEESMEDLRRELYGSLDRVTASIATAATRRGRSAPGSCGCGAFGPAREEEEGDADAEAEEGHQQHRERTQRALFRAKGDTGAAPDSPPTKW